jgi:outer membrane immunogenic protein
MKGFRLFCGISAGLILAVAAGQASADGYRGRSVKDYERPFTWTGFYIGGHAGLATGDTQGTPDLGGGPPGLLSTDYSLNGALYGGQVGFNWQTGPLVLGVEGSLSSSSVQGNTTCAFLLECKRDIDWLATVTGRVGYAMGRSLVYGLAGVAWADVNTNVGIVGVPILSGSETHVGWVAGFGFEHALSNHITARIEYAHVDLGREDHGLAVVGGGPVVVTDRVDVKMDTIRLGVNIKFTQ